MPTCNACQTAVLANAKFCNNCGVPLSLTGDVAAGAGDATVSKASQPVTASVSNGENPVEKEFASADGDKFTVTVQKLVCTVAKVQQRVESTTKISSEGGGGYVQTNGYNGAVVAKIAPVEISSRTSHQTINQIWFAAQNQKELVFEFDNQELALREGHHVSLFFAKESAAGKDYILYGAVCEESGQQWTNENIFNHQLVKPEPKWGNGGGFILLMIITFIGSLFISVILNSRFYPTPHEHEAIPEQGQISLAKQQAVIQNITLLFSDLGCTNEDLNRFLAVHYYKNYKFKKSQNRFNQWWEDEQQKNEIGGKWGSCTRAGSTAFLVSLLGLFLAIHLLFIFRRARNNNVKHALEMKGYEASVDLSRAVASWLKNFTARPAAE